MSEISQQPQPDPLHEGLEQAARVGTELINILTTAARTQLEVTSRREMAGAATVERQIRQQEKDAHHAQQQLREERIEHDRASRAARDELKDRARRARAVYAAGLDREYLATADVEDVVRVWAAAVPWSGEEADAGRAMRMTEGRLAELHPEAVRDYRAAVAGGEAPLTAMLRQVPRIQADLAGAAADGGSGRDTRHRDSSGPADLDELFSRYGTLDNVPPGELLEALGYGPEAQAAADLQAAAMPATSADTDRRAKAVAKLVDRHGSLVAIPREDLLAALGYDVEAFAQAEATNPAADRTREPDARAVEEDLQPEADQVDQTIDRAEPDSGGDPGEARRLQDLADDLRAQAAHADEAQARQLLEDAERLERESSLPAVVDGERRPPERVGDFLVLTNEHGERVAVPISETSDSPEQARARRDGVDGTARPSVVHDLGDRPGNARERLEQARARAAEATRIAVVAAEGDDLRVGLLALERAMSATGDTLAEVQRAQLGLVSPDTPEAAEILGTAALARRQADEALASGSTNAPTLEEIARTVEHQAAVVIAGDAVEDRPAPPRPRPPSEATVVDPGPAAFRSTSSTSRSPSQRPGGPPQQRPKR